MLGAIIVLAVAGALAYNYSVKPLSSGDAVISAGESIPSQPFTRMNGDIPRLKSVIDKEIARITSRELATCIVKQIGPKERAELATGPLGPWYRRLRFFGETPAAQAAAPLSTAQAVTALRSRLRVDWREPSTWVEIRMMGHDPEAVAELANAIATAYVSETAEANRQTLEASASSLDSQLRTKEKQLGEQLSGLRELGTETGLGDLAARKAILERQIRGFQDALVAAQTARVGRAATGREAAQMEGGALAAASDPRVLSAQTRVSELEDREKALLSTLREQHPHVVTVREQLQSAPARL